MTITSKEGQEDYMKAISHIIPEKQAARDERYLPTV